METPKLPAEIKKLDPVHIAVTLLSVGVTAFVIAYAWKKGQQFSFKKDEKSSYNPLSGKKLQLMPCAKTKASPCIGADGKAIWRY